MAKKKAETKVASSAVSADEAKAALIKEKQDRIQACGQEIQSALMNHNCELDVSMTIGTRGIMPNINIIAKDIK